MTDRDTGRRRGFIFVTFLKEESVERVIEKKFHKIDDATVC